jgi:hypothetical protein
MPKMIIFLDATLSLVDGIRINYNVCTVYYFVMYKELKMVWAWLVLFLIALPLFVLWEFDISTTALDPDLSPNDSPVNPLLGPPTAADADMLHEVSLLLRDN